MVVLYLEKIRTQYQEKRIDANGRLTAAQNEYKENTEIIKLLEVNNDPNFESFTPRQVNGFNKTKIAELQERQKALTTIMSDIREEIAAIDSEIYEINSVIKVAREKKVDLDNTVLKDTSYQDESKIKLALLETQENERQRIARELHDSTLTSLVHKTELSLKLVDADPIRCKLELTSMGKTIRDIIQDTRNMIYDLRPMSFDDIGFDIGPKTIELFKNKLSAEEQVKFDAFIENIIKTYISSYLAKLFTLK